MRQSWGKSQGGPCHLLHLEPSRVALSLGIIWVRKSPGCEEWRERRKLSNLQSAMLLELPDCPAAWSDMLWARLAFLNGVRYFHAGSDFIFPQHVCKKLGYFFSLYQIACLWANGKWNFRFSGAQRAEVGTLAESKLSFSPLLKAWFNKVLSNLDLLIRVGKSEQRKLLPPLLSLEETRQRNPPYECCCICVFWSSLKYLEHFGLWSSAKPIIC